MAVVVGVEDGWDHAGVSTSSAAVGQVGSCDSLAPPQATPSARAAKGSGDRVMQRSLRRGKLRCKKAVA
jgi:hypothetical protein